jgi:hypothetical protein
VSVESLYIAYQDFDNGPVNCLHLWMDIRRRIQVIAARVPQIPDQLDSDDGTDSGRAAIAVISEYLLGYVNPPNENPTKSRPA